MTSVVGCGWAWVPARAASASTAPPGSCTPPVGSAQRRPTPPCVDFLQERWKGVWPILYGDQLRQARFDEWVFHGVLDVDHLPAETTAEMRSRQRYDVVVIGAGTAGLVAGSALAEAGAQVCVLAKGVGSTHLAPGTIDVLGYRAGGRRLSAGGDRGACR